MTDQLYRANRVSQIEARQLDWELVNTIDNVVEQLEVPSYSEELKTILKLYLFSNNVLTGASPGMRAYNMTLCEISRDRASTITHSPKRRLAMLATLDLVASYLTRRYEMFERLLESSKFSKMKIPWASLDNMILLTRCVSVLNFFLFLRTGMYLSIPERVLGLVPHLSQEGCYNNLQMNRVQIDYMYREVIWKALAEFLTTLIPLVSLEKIKGNLARVTGLMPKLQGSPTLWDKMKTESNSNRCALCLKQPFNPYIIGCRHVFCYFCLQSRYLSDPSNGYVCLSCEYKTCDQDNVRRYRVLDSP